MFFFVFAVRLLHPLAAFMLAGLLSCALSPFHIWPLTLSTPKLQAKRKVTGALPLLAPV
jgi:hypothetical protein